MKRKIFSVLLAIVFCLSMSVMALAASDANLYDDADLLSDAEETRLGAKLDAACMQYDAQIVIATVSYIDGSVDWFVEEVYDSMNIGYGTNRDGVLLLVCMDTREYRILSNGYAGVAIDGGDINAIGDAIVSDLSDGNYEDAFNTFIDRCEYYLNGYINGFPFNFGKNLLVAVVIGIIAGVIVAFVLKRQLKTVRKQNQANVYVKPGSMQLTASNDFFLYRTVNRSRKQCNSSGSSSSSRSVGGGSF